MLAELMLTFSLFQSKTIVFISTYMAGNTVEMAQGLSHGAIDRVGRHVEYGMTLGQRTLNGGCETESRSLYSLAKMSSQGEV